VSRFNLPSHRPPTHPGEVLLEEFLKPLDLSQTEFAGRIGVSYVRLNAVVNGRRTVTPDTALRLERATGMDADFWLDLQTRWDLWHALHSDAAKEIARIQPVPGLVPPADAA
jgi:antitoxin HigA-1